MILDAVVTEPQVTWLATEGEKLAHVTLLLGTRFPRADLPQLVFRGGGHQTIRHFPDRLPIGVPADGRLLFVYLVTRSSPVDFRAFLQRHAELLRALPAWTLRLVVPQHLGGAIGRFEVAWREELATPLRLSTVEELRWYFPLRRRLAQEPGAYRRIAVWARASGLCRPTFPVPLSRVAAAGGRGAGRGALTHSRGRDRPRSRTAAVACLGSSVLASLPLGGHGVTHAPGGARRRARRPGHTWPPFRAPGGQRVRPPNSGPSRGQSPCNSRPLQQIASSRCQGTACVRRRTEPPPSPPRAVQCRGVSDPGSARGSWSQPRTPGSLTPRCLCPAHAVNRPAPPSVFHHDCAPETTRTSRRVSRGGSPRIYPSLSRYQEVPCR